MIYLVSIYLFLFIFRPYEYWPILGDLRVERIYMLGLMAAVFFWPGKRWIPHPINRRLLVFFAVMLVSAFFALKTADAAQGSFDFFKIIVFYVIIVLTVRDEKDLRRFLIAYLAIMALYVGKSAWEFFLNDRFVYRMGIRRMIGVDITYGDPNSLAASIAYSLPLLWALLRSSFEGGWVRPFLWGYGALAGLAIVFTGSRSGMVTCLLFLVLLWWQSNRKLAGGMVLALLLVGVWIKMPADLQSRFLSTFQKTGSEKAEAKWAAESAEGRLLGLKQGLRIFRSHPVLGIGPNNFRYGWDDPKQMHQAHNLYGQTLGELGGAGFIAFFALVWTIFRTHRRNLAEITSLERGEILLPEEEQNRLLFLRRIALASMQTILLLLFNGNFGHNLYRYNWLWIGALGILSAHFLSTMKREGVRLS